MAFFVPHVPPNIEGLPHGLYGITYDISTRRTEDDLPDGWHSRRASTYRALLRSLRQAGFVRHQYSDYRRHNSNPVAVWTTMIFLAAQVQPPGKLQSTLLGLKMHHIEHLHDMDVTDQLRLGGAFTPWLMGPTPAGLVAEVPDGLLNPVPVVPGPDFIRPVFTRPSAAANSRFNYRM
ncbi:hypothetical protein EI94DRAFT_1696985 [Lactarius quietus]|nr:hypothetical protein EI94DRAFT_1696985 [Lactarius quietus]